MTQWKTVLAQGALAGSLASLLSTAVLVIAGRRQSGSAAACLADYEFTPGFEHRLPGGALAGVYAAFAVGLAAGALVLRDQYRGHERASKVQALPAVEEEPPLVVRRVRAGHI